MSKSDGDEPNRYPFLFVTDPTFFVIGAQKCGTTWLARMLDQHPDVFMSDPKELHFFNNRDAYAKGMDTYRRNFASASGQRAVGEATPNYLWLCPNRSEIDDRGVIPDVAPVLHEHYPDARLIVMLRDPVERARSAYFHFAKGRAFRPGRSILDVGHENGIITMGDYLPQIERWLDLFDAEQFLFLCYEDDVAQNKVATLRRVHEFLDVDPSHEASALDQRYNARTGHLYMRLNHAAPRLAPALADRVPRLRSSNLARITIAESELQELAARYREVNAGLGELIGCDLPW